jgi:hypothetical protein
MRHLRPGRALRRRAAGVRSIVNFTNGATAKRWRAASQLGNTAIYSVLFDAR